MNVIYPLVIILLSFAGIAYLLFRINLSIDRATIELSKIARSELLKYKLTPEPTETQEAYVESLNAEAKAALRTVREAESTRAVGRRRPMSEFAQLDDI